MANQTTSSTLAFLNEAEKTRVQEMYQMVKRKQGNIKFDDFWRQLHDCFYEGESSATEKVTHHAIVAFKKQAGRYEPTINKRTQLIGKAGPDKRKREDDSTESIPDDQCFATRKQVQDLFSLVMQLVKNTNPQKENQGQGRQGDRDCGSCKESDNY